MATSRNDEDWETALERVCRLLQTVYKYDQYVKAMNHIGVVSDMQGRLLDVVGQVRDFEQSLLRVMKGLSRAFKIHAKWLLNGDNEFLERLRTLLTATEQAAQTFAEKQAEA